MIGVGLLLCFSPEGKTGCFPLKKSGRFVFADSAFALSAFFVPFLSPAYGGRKNIIVVSGQLPAQVFRLRRKTPQKQKQIAFGRNKFACGRNKNLIRSQSRLARRDWRPLKESSGRAQILAEKGDWRGLLA